MFYYRLDFTRDEEELLRYLYHYSRFTSFQAFVHSLLMQQAKQRVMCHHVIELALPPPPGSEEYMTGDEEDAFLRRCRASNLKERGEPPYQIIDGGKDGNGD